MPGTGCPLRSVSVAVSDWSVPTTSGPAVSGLRVSVAPTSEDCTTVVKLADSGPYGLPLASVQVTCAVSVSGPSGWLSGTPNVAVAVAPAPVPRLAGTPDRVPWL